MPYTRRLSEPVRGPTPPITKTVRRIEPIDVDVQPQLIPTKEDNERLKTFAKETGWDPPPLINASVATHPPERPATAVPFKPDAAPVPAGGHRPSVKHTVRRINERGPKTGMLAWGSCEFRERGDGEPDVIILDILI